MLEKLNELDQDFLNTLQQISTASDQNSTDQTIHSLETSISKFIQLSKDLETQLTALKDKEFSDEAATLEEEIKILKEDIRTKDQVIDKYVDQIKEWEKELGSLEKRDAEIMLKGSEGSSDMSLTQTKSELRPVVEFEEF
ncbi:hypothetical protein K493DRAFT_338981 [Basidiobolus meristosporus CBS 931.73]|uniref:Mediator of RNA polymerase II transcription subunit 4 n=1 Tax=Basidiobolus meristosporus CBS 931.73 TaxID=1314790 RepID=A0A1Y1Y270_9FUNG|nr:hypothetical protein K493DRAFT_338981 [Basidiobolus meristosporus CBS 931.73]|eukprot:ORX92112.1 hypothetical protein K493DRAFT_338981 [Basidiobolus meristosporus CBS 931.73]